MTDQEQRAMIHRVGKVVRTEDGKYKLPGWFFAGRMSWNLPPVVDREGDHGERDFIIFGWPISELAEISLMIGEGTWLAEPIVALEDIPKEFQP